MPAGPRLAQTRHTWLRMPHGVVYAAQWSVLALGAWAEAVGQLDARCHGLRLFVKRGLKLYVIGRARAELARGELAAVVSSAPELRGHVVDPVGCHRVPAPLSLRQQVCQCDAIRLPLKVPWIHHHQHRRSAPEVDGVLRLAMKAQLLAEASLTEQFTAGYNGRASGGRHRRRTSALSPPLMKPADAFRSQAQSEPTKTMG